MDFEQAFLQWLWDDYGEGMFAIDEAVADGCYENEPCEGPTASIDLAEGYCATICYTCGKATRNPEAEHERAAKAGQLSLDDFAYRDAPGLGGGRRKQI